MSRNGAQTRDIVVVGTSLGGLDALSRLLEQLPADFPASIFIVQHIGEQSAGFLAGILDGRTQLGVQMAVDGMTFERGCAYVAPPGHHMILSRNGLGVVYGPRENLSRPAIDPLFRSAAFNFRSRVVGLLLTGLLNDGTSGLLAVARCGGLALVQALDDAAYPDMPRNAMQAVPQARQVALDDLGVVLQNAVREVAPEPPPVPETIRVEAQLTERGMNEDWNQVPGRPTNFTCPECSGAIRIMDEDGVSRYRCRVGHAYTDETIIAAKDDAAEASLWNALQTLEERVQMLQSMARSERERGWGGSFETLEERVRDAEHHALNLRKYIQSMRA